MSLYKLYVEGGSGANLNTVPDDFEFRIKPFLQAILRPDLFDNTLNNDKEGYFSDPERELPLSMICSGGENKPYSLYFFEGCESKWFLTGNKVYFFEDLFSEMIKQSATKTTTTISASSSGHSGSHHSQRMKRVVLTNCNGPLFEMLDGRLYLFDIELNRLQPFFIENMSQIKCIGSGLMSNIIMVQTMDGKILKKKWEVPAIEIKIEDSSPVKLFTGYCRDLQLIVLENNRLFVVKAGTTDDSHYGFYNGPLDEPFEVKTPFKGIGIQKISAGFGHCVFLLGNGQVFSKGLNNYSQCGKPNQHDVVEDEFYEITSIGCPVTDIECGSVCSAFKTTSHFVVFGSLYLDFDKKTGYQHEIEYEDQQVSMGPWHAFIFRNKYNYFNKGKSGLYFANNLELATRQQGPFEAFCDVEIGFKDL